MSGVVPQASATAQAPEPSTTGNAYLCLSQLLTRTTVFLKPSVTGSAQQSLAIAGAYTAADDDDDVVLVTAPAKQRAATKPGVASAGKRQRVEAESDHTDTKRKKLVPPGDDVISLD